MGWPSLSDVGNAWNSVRNTVSDGADAVSNRVSSTVTSVRETASAATSRVSDFAASARDRAVDLAKGGADLGRRGVEAVRDFDVRDAAAAARAGIARGTEAAREGISTATSWTSERVGDGAEWARNHVPGGDSIASNAVRSVISGAESTTRFQLGVTGGIAREVVGTAGALGQLTVTAAEMQASPEASREYGEKIAGAIGEGARATGGYLQSVANDPTRLAGDAKGAWDATSGFLGDTASRYGQAIREGRTEEIGMDVGTVATYLVPVGGGPARGALTAAVRTGAEVTVRGTVEVAARTAVREGGEAVVRTGAREGSEAVARTAVREGGDAVRATELAGASGRTGREIAVYRDGTTGQRQLVTETAGSAPVRTADGVPGSAPKLPIEPPAASANGVSAATIAETARRTGLSEDSIRTILDTPKPDRPAPASYISADRISAHLHAFEETGAIKFTPRSTIATYGTLGPPDGGFVISRRTFERLIEDTGGDLAKVEDRLQLRPGELTSGDTVIAYIEPQDLNGLRIPSGNERGAWDGLWVPGGYTGKGVAEAVVDLPAGTPYTPVTLEK